jgi:hypothetical protein
MTPQHRLRDREAKRLRGLEVDHQLELGRLHHRQEALRALRDRIARQRSEPTTEKEHLARRIRRALGRLLRPSSTSG